MSDCVGVGSGQGGDDPTIGSAVDCDELALNPVQSGRCGSISDAKLTALSGLSCLFFFFLDGGRKECVYTDV